MKKLLVLSTFIIGLMSCDDNNKVTITKQQYKVLTHDSIPDVLIVNGEEYPIVKGSDGHQYYLMVIATGAYTAYHRPFHLPSCELCQKLEIMKIKAQ